MTKKWKKILLFLAGLFAVQAAFAGNSIETAMANFQQAGASINSKLIVAGTRTACVAVLIQWILTYSKEIFTGEISNTLAKGFGILTWFGASMALLKFPDVLSNAYFAYLKLAGNLAGLSTTDFTPGTVIDQGATVLSALWSGALKMVGNHAWEIGQNIIIASVMIVVSVIIMASYFMIALGLFVANLEFWMMFAVAPLAFGLIPLSAFRDQGFAPIKGAMSLGLRLLILGIVVAVAKQLTETAINNLANLKQEDGQVLLAVYYSYLAGIFGCAVMAISAGKIASSIASGSANFSGSDAIKAGMAIAATAGAAGALGGGALNLAKEAASAGGKGLSALGNGLEALKNAAAPKVSPSALGGAPGGAPSSMNGFGGPPTRERPSLGASSNAGSSTPSASPTPGNANSAGIGGPNSGGQPQQPKGPGALDQLSSSLSNAANQHAQDGHSVGVQMHISKD